MKERRLIERRKWERMRKAVGTFVFVRRGKGGWSRGRNKCEKERKFERKEE